jgi:hypothetical protein
MANEPPDTGKQTAVPVPVLGTKEQPTEQAKTVPVVPAAPPPPPPTPPPQPPSTSWLLAKDMPYALTILLAVLAWCVVHAIDTIEDSPSIEYVKMVKRRDDGAFDVAFRVNNISLKHFFRGVSFYIKAPEGVLSKPNLTAFPPGKEVNGENPDPGDISPPAAHNRRTTCRYFVAQLQPATSWEFKAVLSDTSDPDPKLLVDFAAIGTNPEVKVEPVGIRLIEQGLETCLVKHKIIILFVASILWFTIVVIYVIYLLSIRKKST